MPFTLQQQVIALGYYFRNGYEKTLGLNKTQLIDVDFSVLEQEEFLCEYESEETEEEE